MRAINMDQIFSSLHDSYHTKQEHKMKCITHYFERICSSPPSNFVSFERKVLSLEQNPSVVPLPSPDFWAKSVTLLCKFKVFPTGKIEHHPPGASEVDFADEFIGGLVLTKGCVQEEIRFMMNPELIASMLFMLSMSENEAIKMVGAERFSNYRGYNASFQYAGDYVDRRGVDALQRRMTRVVAIDALRRAGTKQYQSEFLLREVNKAFCGFLGHNEYQQQQQEVHDSNVGVATGNWGCGIFGGDPQLSYSGLLHLMHPDLLSHTIHLDWIKCKIWIRLLNGSCLKSGLLEIYGRGWSIMLPSGKVDQRWVSFPS